jgi:hypothetical protein
VYNNNYSSLTGTKNKVIYQTSVEIQDSQNQSGSQRK